MDREILEASKILADYLGWKYYGFQCAESIVNPNLKLGWYKNIRNLSDLHSVLQYNTKLSHRKIDENTVGNYVCRHHTGLRFFNSYDALFEVIDKLENEDLSEYMYSWTDSRGDHNNFSCVEVDINSYFIQVGIELQLDPDIIISGAENEKLPKKERLFWALVNAVKYINNLKNG